MCQLERFNNKETTAIRVGSVVIRDLPDNCTAVGSPAKVIKIKGIV
ncbi:MAG: hypothetical protein M0Q14_10340 [Tissierellaceae bacterium]|nr:hypothetical protein [Tissierellaceae bacterium]